MARAAEATPLGTCSRRVLQRWREASMVSISMSCLSSLHTRLVSGSGVEPFLLVDHNIASTRDVHVMPM